MAETINVRPVMKLTPNKCGPSSLSRKLKNITTPQPFKLTSHNCVPKRALKNCKHEQIKREMEKREKDIEIEHLKQFRANPIPAHTFLPLFQQIQIEKAQKRDLIKQQVKMQLIAKQKPFDLSCYKAPVRQCLSVSDLNSAAKEKCGQHFRATPLPKNHNSKPLLEMMAEQEILREIRLRRRTEQLIKSSALPFSIPRDTVKKHRFEDAITKERVIRSASSTLKSTSQHGTHSSTVRFEMPPDVDKILYKASTKNCLKSTMKTNEIVHWRRSASVSVIDCLTPRMTYGAILRERANRERCKESAEIPHVSSEKHKACLKMKRDLLTKIILHQPSVSNEERLHQFRQDNKAHMKEYHQEMQKMVERVKARPFLVERQSQLSAMHKLDKKFRELLQRQGLDEDFIFAKSKPIDAQHLLSNISDESENEPSSAEEGDAKRSRSEGNDASSDSVDYSSDANTEDQPHSEAEETFSNSSGKGTASETELPERDIS